MKTLKTRCIKSISGIVMLVAVMVVSFVNQTDAEMTEVFNRNITNEAHQQLHALKSQGIRVFAFTPSGGWVIITNRNQMFARNVPNECYEKLKEYQRKNEKILWVAFPPRGGNSWSIITENTFFNRNIPEECHQKMLKFQREGNRVRFVAFPPRGGNSWIILLQRGFYARNTPDDCYPVIRDVEAGNGKVHAVAFDPDKKGWVVITNDYFFAYDVDDELLEQMLHFHKNRRFIHNVAFDPDRRGWSLSTTDKVKPANVPITSPKCALSGRVKHYSGREGISISNSTRNYNISIDQNGRFGFSQLPVGEYEVVLLSGLKDDAIYPMQNISCREGKSYIVNFD